MKGALKFLPVCTAFCIVCAGWAAPMEPRAAASALAKQFSFDEGGSLPRVAVTDVKDLSGGVNELGRLLAEELIQAFFATGKCDVIERGMLEKLLKEQKLAATGILDPASTQQLGKISGVDYLFVGLLTDLGDAYSLHGRLLSTQTGVIAQVGSVEVAKSSETQPLRERTLARPEASGGGAQFAGKELGLRPGTVWFQDFSSYQPGDIPREAGDQFMVSRVEGIRKNAIKVRSGRKDGEGVFAVPFPRNFVFEFSHCHNGGNGSNEATFDLALMEGRQLVAQYTINYWTANGAGCWQILTMPAATPFKQQYSWGNENPNRVRMVAREGYLSVWVSANNNARSGPRSWAMVWRGPLPPQAHPDRIWVRMTGLEGALTDMLVSGID